MVVGYLRLLQEARREEASEEACTRMFTRVFPVQAKVLMYFQDLSVQFSEEILSSTLPIHTLFTPPIRTLSRSLAKDFISSFHANISTISVLQVSRSQDCHSRHGVSPNSLAARSFLENENGAQVLPSSE